MPRRPKPFFHRGWWCTNVGGSRTKAGIGPDENGEQVVLYTARHTFGTGAAAAGVSDRRLADLMGHTDPKMTQKYIHLANPDLQRAAREATKGYLGANRNGGSSS
jgi:integrase